MARLHRTPKTLLRRGKSPSGIPSLRRGDDVQALRVHALLSPAADVLGWRRALRMGTSSRRAAAALALGTRLGGQASLMLGRTLMKDPDAWVRQHAALGLQHADSAAATRILCRAFGVERDVVVQGALVRALGHAAGHEDDVERALLSALASGEPMVVEAALWALQFRSHPLCSHAAVNLLQHAQAEVRRVAAAVLSACAPGHVALREARSDQDHAVAMLAAHGA